MQELLQHTLIMVMDLVPFTLYLLGALELRPDWWTVIYYSTDYYALHYYCDSFYYFGGTAAVTCQRGTNIDSIVEYSKF